MLFAGVIWNAKGTKLIGNGYMMLWSGGGGGGGGKAKNGVGAIVASWLVEKVKSLKRSMKRSRKRKFL